MRIDDSFPKQQNDSSKFAVKNSQLGAQWIIEFWQDFKITPNVLLAKICPFES